MSMNKKNIYCSACNVKFVDVSAQKLHYKTEWHLYNLKRQVASYSSVSESIFQARQAEENKKQLNETPMVYRCCICAKGYRSSSAHAQHLKSKSHLVRAAQVENPENDDTSIRPLMRRTSKKDAKTEIGAAVEDLDLTCCFMCDLENPSLETCMLHLHKKHGLFIPDIEYLNDLKGLLTYLSLKVRRDYSCLYCDDRCHPFASLEAVRKHMVAKSHCKIHFGEGGDDEEVELEEFYDYSNSYKDKDGQLLQLVVKAEADNRVELGCGGCELILKTRTESGRQCAKTLGSREFVRYYKQNPRPTPANDLAICIAKAETCSKIIGLTLEQRKERATTLRVWGQIRRFGKEAVRIKRSIRRLAQPDKRNIHLK